MRVRGRIERALEESNAVQAQANLDTAERQVSDALTTRLRVFVMQSESQLGFPPPTDWRPSLQKTMQRRLDATQQADDDRLQLLRAIDADLLREKAAQFNQEVGQQREAELMPAMDMRPMPIRIKSFAGTHALLSACTVVSTVLRKRSVLWPVLRRSAAEHL